MNSAESTSPLSSSTSESAGGGAGHYATVNGLRLYYERQGGGPALLLLHGGLCAIPVWRSALRAFARSHEVIAVEQMGHGRTADDPSRPMNYRQMAADTAELLSQLKIENACVLGWSDGGVVGLYLALDHPHCVGKLAISGTHIRPAGPPKQGDVEMTAEDIPPFIRKPYDDLSPDGPAHWANVYERLTIMWRTQPNFTLEQLAQIKAATLIIAGDRDAVSVEETTTLWRAIPNAQLWIAPDSDHGLPLSQPTLFNATVAEFFHKSERPTA